MARPKGASDIAPLIRSAFIRAVRHMEEDKKNPVRIEDLIRKNLQENFNATISALSKFSIKEVDVVYEDVTDAKELTDDELANIAAASSARINKSQSSKKKTNPVH